MEKRKREQRYVSSLKLAAFVLQGTLCMMPRKMAGSFCVFALPWSLFFIPPINQTVQPAGYNPAHPSHPLFYYYLYLFVYILYISSEIKTMSVIKMIVLMYWIQICWYSQLVQNVCILSRHSLLGFELLKHNNKQVEKITAVITSDILCCSFYTHGFQSDLQMRGLIL